VTLRPGDADSPQVPAGAAQRLEVLRRLYVPEPDTDARERLARERPFESLPFDVAVGARLRELRALCELSNYLHQARPSRPHAASR
jgi:hypothetical protein